MAALAVGGSEERKMPNFEADDRSVVEFQLGNKQLILLFLGLLVICAIFFFIGLRVGEDTAKGKAAIVVNEEDGAAGDDAETDEAGTVDPAADPLRTASARKSNTSNRRQNQPATNSSSSSRSANPPKAKESAVKTETLTKTAGNRAGFVSSPPEGWYVQVVAVTKKSAAAKQEKLIQTNLPTAIHEVTVNGQQYYRVLVGPFNSKEKAERNKKSLSKAFKNPILKRFKT